MTVMTSESPQTKKSPALEEPHLASPPKPLVHPRWILMGSLAMMLGLIMGYIMSSLAK